MNKYKCTLVNEERLLEFLEEEVVAKGNKKKINADGTPVPIGIQSYEANVKALVALYFHQVACNKNKNPHPRGPGVSSFLSLQRKKEATRRVESKADTGKGTINDAYTSLEKRNVCKTNFLLIYFQPFFFIIYFLI